MGVRTIPQRWRQPKGEDRTEMKKRGKIIEVYFAQWIGLERKVRYLFCDRGTDRGRRQQFNREAKDGWRFAANAARITD